MQKLISEIVDLYHIELKLAAFIFYYVAAALYYTQAEGWSLLDTVYYATVTMTTVGYGIFHPDYESARLATIFLILFGTFVVLFSVNQFAKSVLVGAQEELILHLQRWRGVEETPPNTLRAYKVWMSIMMIVILGIVGSLFFTETENVTYLDGVYWVIVTMSTVGYGDVVPTTKTAKGFCILFLLAAVSLYATSANIVLDQWVEYVSDSNNAVRGSEETELSQEWVERMLKIANQPDGISKERFILEVLLRKKAISWQRDVGPINEVFYCVFHEV
jgi:voltage-gated potassium channel Kch